MNTMNVRQNILKQAARRGLFRPRDLGRLPGLSEQLRRLVVSGQVIRPARGLYALPDADMSEHFSLAQASLLVPGGVICLLSALSYHQLSTQLPHQVWLAIPRNRSAPRVKDIPLRMVRMADDIFDAGALATTIDGVKVRIYEPARTIADCFKFRNRIGVDVAVQALTEALRKNICSRQQILRFAGLCRVDRVMRPYLEALLA